MKLLALDTAMAACSVAVYDSDRNALLASAFAPMERGHAEAIAPMVRDVMAAAAVAFAGLDRIVVTRGPGTFTGVRIGLAMARGLGLALDRPVTGIDTLSAIAANETQSAMPLLVAADARKNEVYAALIDGEGELVAAPAVIALGDCVRLLPPGPVVVIGSGADAVMAAAGRTDVRRSRAGDVPNAANFALRFRYSSESRGPPEPLYLRAPDAKPQGFVQRPPLAIQIREVTAGDAGVLAALHGECFDDPWTAGDFIRLVTMPGASALLAMEVGEPVGFVLLRRAADEAEIITIATRPFAQRRGVAGTLMKDLSQRLAAQGCRALFIEVAASNMAARALYGSLGFTAAGLRKDYYARPAGRREDALVMRRDL